MSSVLVGGCASSQLTKNEAIVGVTAFETAARTANSTINQNTGLPWLNDRDTGLIVTFAESAIAGLQAQTSDWRTALAAAWRKFKLTWIVDPNNVILLAGFAALNILLAPYGG